MFSFSTLRRGLLLSPDLQPQYINGVCSSVGTIYIIIGLRALVVPINEYEDVEIFNKAGRGVFFLKIELIIK